METEIERRPPHIEAQDFDREHRLYNDTTTWLAEVLPGVMRNTFEYRYDGFELYADDESALEKTFDDAVKDAERLARYHPNLAFELRRRILERGEYDDMIAMMRGELGNTMVVVSDFPPELMDVGEDVGGYNVRRRQTMLRVISRKPDGRLVMTSQSLDGSERLALEKLYQVLGARAEEGELLGQRIHLDIDPSQQDSLVDSLRNVYDKSLTDRYGGEWYAGRRGSEAGLRSNTYDFVCAQEVLLQTFIQEASTRGEVDEDLLYDLAAEMERRFSGNENATEFIPENVDPIAYSRDMLYSSGERARNENKTYSGCGMSLGGYGQGADSELAASGYGNKTNEETKYNFDKFMHCVVCQAPPKKGESKRLCGPCGICKHCDKIIKIKAK